MLRHALWRSTKAYQQQVRSASIGRWRTSCPTTRMADNVTSQRMAGPFLNGANLRLFPWGGQFHFCSSVFSLGRRRAAWYSIVEDGPMVHALYRTAAMIQTLAYTPSSSSQLETILTAWIETTTVRLLIVGIWTSFRIEQPHRSL